MSAQEQARLIIEETAAHQRPHITLSTRQTGTVRPLPEALSEVPHELATLSWVRHINLSFNTIRELPVNVCSLRGVQYMGLHHNRLARLPQQIDQLRALMTLDLRYNRLDELPIELGWLPHLQTLLVVEGNTLRNFPAHVVEAGDDAVLAWIKKEATDSTRS